MLKLNAGFLAGFVLSFVSFGFAQTADIEIDQSRGLDQRVDYRSLLRFGPWDDRNYKLTLEDLEVLPPGEADQKANIPAWFRVYVRKTAPWLQTEGEAQYPRHIDVIFRINHGGFLRNGVYVNHVDADENQAEKKLIRVPVSNERKISNFVGAAESAIAFNPVNSQQIIAGTNNFNVPGGGVSEMLYSVDGGTTFTTVSLPAQGSTGGDPTVAWSSDGQYAYSGVLASCLAVCNIRFFRSADGGQTWNDLPGPGYIDITNQGRSDKEYLHVDLSPSSPYLDRIYMTWHDGNVLQFAKSRDFGSTWDPVISFTSDPTGIGSDITSDTNGTIFYFYPGLNSNKGIWLLKSTDGGETFSPATQIAVNQDGFIYPLPSFNFREAFIYVAADTDRSNGPFKDSVYAVWSDLTAPQSSAANNHSVIKFAYSRDGGTTWNITNPHEMNDVNSVDRYNPWMEVDSSGNIHVIFYDTRRDPARLKNDLFYTYSTDGGVTFSSPERITSQQSDKISDTFEWGDYNGMTLVENKIMPIWTDNRPDNDRGTSDIDVYIAEVSNQTGGCGGSDLAVSTDETLDTCSGSGIVLDAIAEGGTGPYTYAWTPSDNLDDATSATPLATLTETTAFMVTVTDALGCTAQANVTVFVYGATLQPLTEAWQGPYDEAIDYDRDGFNTVLDMVVAMNVCQPEE